MQPSTPASIHIPRPAQSSQSPPSPSAPSQASETPVRMQATRMTSSLAGSQLCTRRSACPTDAVLQPHTRELGITASLCVQVSWLPGPPAGVSPQGLQDLWQVIQKAELSADGLLCPAGVVSCQAQNNAKLAVAASLPALLAAHPALAVVSARSESQLRLLARCRG